MAKLLSVKAAAEYLGVSDDTLRAYESRGYIAAVRYPSLSIDGPRRRRLFRQEECDRFIAACQPESAGHDAGHIDESQQPEMVGNKATKRHGPAKPKSNNVHWIEKYAAK